MEALTSLRKALHQAPELSGKEINTSLKIKDWFDALNPSSTLTDIGGHGLIITFDSGKSGPHIAFRCELDALPIEEVNSFNHRSHIEGVSHKCGHDGHMTILAGLGLWLSQTHLPKGRVSLIYQPAEEIGIGAKAMIDDEKWPGDIDYIFALHNLPGFPYGQILLYPEAITPTVLSIAIELQGITSHASQPHEGINPSIAISEIIHQLLQLNQPKPHEDEFQLITPVHTLIGSKDYGISPGYGETHFTMRTKDEESMDQLKRKITDIIDRVSVKHKLTTSISYSDYFPSVHNHVDCFREIKEICIDHHIPFHILDDPLPFGEDFGFFTQSINGVFMGIGSGVDTPPLHHNTYDFPDRIIPQGIHIFKEIINYLINH